MNSADRLVKTLLNESTKHIKGDRLVLTRRGNTWVGTVTGVTRKLGWSNDLITMKGSWSGGPDTHVTVLEVFSDEPGLRAAV